MKIIHTCCTGEVVLRINTYERDKVREALNLAIVGHKHCNKYNSKGKIVSKKYPADKLQKLEDAHHKAFCGRRINITFDITDEGEWVNFRVEAQ